MGYGAWRLRAGALVLIGALAVHELRYLLPERHQDEHAHAYMAWLVPIACALLGLALAEFAVRLARRIRTDDRPAYIPAGVRWLTASTLLTAIFALQEVTERLLAHGRVDVAESLVVHGGWIALPLCFVVGAVIARAPARCARAAHARLGSHPARAGASRRASPPPATAARPARGRHRPQPRGPRASARRDLTCRSTTKEKPMKKFIALAAVAAGLLGVAAPAMAHVTLQPTEAPADGFTRLSVRVPNERDDASTTKVRVQFPPGFYSISYEPVDGLERRREEAEARASRPSCSARRSTRRSTRSRSPRPARGSHRASSATSACR